MSGHVTLLGSEEVEAAGRNMQGAADQISRAVQQFEDATLRLSAMLEEKLGTLEQILDAHANKVSS